MHLSPCEAHQRRRTPPPGDDEGRRTQDAREEAPQEMTAGGTTENDRSKRARERQQSSKRTARGEGKRRGEQERAATRWLEPAGRWPPAPEPASPTNFNKAEGRGLCMAPCDGADYGVPRRLGLRGHILRWGPEARPRTLASGVRSQDKGPEARRQGWPSGASKEANSPLDRVEFHRL